MGLRRFEVPGDMNLRDQKCPLRLRLFRFSEIELFA
jgi:hypothetical protein